MLQSSKTLFWRGILPRNTDKSFPYFWPLSEPRTSHLVELSLVLETVDAPSWHGTTPDGYSIQSLPKTLVRAELCFPSASLPFVIADLLNRDSVQARIDEQLPALEVLSLRGAVKGSFVLIPKSVTHYSFLGPIDGLYIPDAQALPPFIEHLIIPNLNLYDDTVTALPPSLKTLDYQIAALVCAPPSLTSLSAHSIKPPLFSVSEYPPNLKHLSIRARHGWPWDYFPPGLTSLHIDSYMGLYRHARLDLPPNLTKFTTKSTKRPEIGITVELSEEILSLLPASLQTISLPFTSTVVPKVMQYLPTGLTSLDMRYSKIPTDEYSLLPLSLTELFVSSYSSANAKHIERLINLKEFGAFGGILSAKSVKQLPRGLVVLQLHGVALDTQTQRRWKNYRTEIGKSTTQGNSSPLASTTAANTSTSSFSSKASSASKYVSSLSSKPSNSTSSSSSLPGSKQSSNENSLKPVLDALHGTLPPSLKKLVVFHHYSQLYYWEHTPEIYKDLPVSLEEVHLLFWQDRRKLPPRVPRASPSYISLQEMPDRGPEFAVKPVEPKVYPSLAPSSKSKSKVSSPYSTVQSSKASAPYPSYNAPSASNAASGASSSSSSSSSSTASPEVTSWKNNMFARLINLKALTFDCPSAASYDHSLIEMPSSGSLRYLHNHCWVSFTEDDLNAIPSSVIAFKANMQAYSTFLTQAYRRHPHVNPHIDYYCNHRTWYLLY